MLNPFTVFGFCWLSLVWGIALFAQEPIKRTYQQTGGRKAYVEITPGESKSLLIQVTPFAPEDRFGGETGIEIDLTKEPYRFYPELKRGEPISLRLSTRNIQDWGKLNFLNHSVISTELKQFMQANREELLQLRKRELEKIDWQLRPLKIDKHFFSLATLSRWIQRYEEEAEQVLDKSTFKKSVPRPLRSNDCTVTRPSLIVTHAEGYWTRSARFSKNINALVDAFRRKGDVLYISSGEDPEYDWLVPTRPQMGHCNRDGNHHFSIKTNEIVVAGGNFAHCQGLAMVGAVQNSPKESPLTIHVPTESTYLGNRTLKEIYDSETENGRLFAFMLMALDEMFDFSRYPNYSFCGQSRGLEGVQFSFSYDGKLVVPQVGTGERRITIAFWSKDQKMLDHFSNLNPTPSSRVGGKTHR